MKFDKREHKQYKIKILQTSQLSKFLEDSSYRPPAPINPDDKKLPLPEAIQQVYWVCDTGSQIQT